MSKIDYDQVLAFQKFAYDLETALENSELAQPYLQDGVEGCAEMIPSMNTKNRAEGQIWIHLSMYDEVLDVHEAGWEFGLFRMKDGKPTEERIEDTDELTPELAQAYVEWLAQDVGSKGVFNFTQKGLDDEL